LYFRQLGTKVTVPRGYGDKVKIPRWQTPIKTTSSQAAITGSHSAVTRGVTEGTVITPKSLCAENITGSTIQFAGARAYSDKVVLVTRANFAEGALESLGRELAFRVDDYTMGTISGNAWLRSVGHQQVISGVGTTDILAGKEIARIAPSLDSYNVPRWDDSTFVGVAHPLAQFDIYKDISATGFVSVARYGDVSKIYRGEIGQMFGVRLLLSNAVTVYAGATGSASGTQGLSGGATGSHIWVFAPDAFYSIELEDGGVEVIHQPPGSSGSVSDPAAQVGSIAVKMHYGIAPAPSADKRLMKFAHGISLGL
jgi:N4-gp56 family major capsid protein